MLLSYSKLTIIMIERQLSHARIRYRYAENYFIQFFFFMYYCVEVFNLFISLQAAGTLFKERYFSQNFIEMKLYKIFRKLYILAGKL